MPNQNGSEAAQVETRPDLFEWHGAEVIFIPLMMAVGILGNCLVLYITHFRWENSIFNFFIKILAWLDVSNLVVAMPVYLAFTLSPLSSHYPALCGCTTFVALFTAITSACVLVVIAANRFRKLCMPERSQVTLSLAFKLTVACFVFGVIISVPSVFLFGKNTVPYMAESGESVNISYCFIKKDAELGLLLTWAVIMGLTFLSQTTILVVLYGFTIRVLRQHDHRIASMRRRPSAASTVSKTISRKHTWVFIAVTVVFFIAYSPYFVTVILSLSFPAFESRVGCVGKAFLDVCKLFPLLSNVSNPIIYSFTSNRFWGECKKIFKLRPCRKALNLIRKDSVTHSHEMSHSENSTPNSPTEVSP